MKRFEALTEPTGETIPDPYEERRAALTAERQKARREEQDYAAVRRNVEEFLSPPRQKDMELKCPLGQTFCRDLRFPLSFCRNVRYNEDINDFEGGEPHDKRRGIAALFYRSGYHIVACAVASILLHESCPQTVTKNRPFQRNRRLSVVRPVRFERMAFGVGVQRSIQLSYGREYMI